MRRVAAISIVLTVGLAMPTRAVEFAGGTGEPNDPYQIATAEQLCSIGSDPNLLSRHFVLVNDIDLDPNLPGGRVFDTAVIAPTTSSNGTYRSSNGTYRGTPFSGDFDGAGHTISNLTFVMEQPSTYLSHLGLFGCVGVEGRVSRLHVTNACIFQSGGLWYSGLLCGENHGVIRDCRANGKISYSNYAGGVGGLAGCNDGFVFRSTADAELLFVDWGTVQELDLLSFGIAPMILMRGGGTGLSMMAPRWLGALVGANSGIIADCYATGSVVGSEYSSAMGGIAGANQDKGIVLRCYCALAGGATQTCVGTVVGGTVANSYYLGDSATSHSESELGTALPDSEMRQQASFVGLDFAGTVEDGTSDTWIMPTDGGYPVLAEERPFDLMGQGTESEPYLLGSVQDLGLITQRPDAHYRLTGDIDCSGIVWPAMLTPWFGGALDGAGYAISHVQLTTTGPGGLVGRVAEQAAIHDLRLDDANIPASRSSWYVGALACINAGTILNCGVTGRIGGDSDVGGLAGCNTGSVTTSFSRGIIAGGSCVGGLVGYNEGGSITASYSNSAVNGIGESIGGLVGYHRGSIVASYSSGAVSAENSWAGGLVGCSRLYGSVTASFCDSEASHETARYEGTSKTTAEMQTAATFLDAGWDFENTWTICEGMDYPRLRWEDVDCDSATTDDGEL
ncbi:MAG: GLUG motif-containing protein [Phycisphaerales bacterium]